MTNEKRQLPPTVSLSQFQNKPMKVRLATRGSRHLMMSTTILGDGKTSTCFEVFVGDQKMDAYWGLALAIEDFNKPVL